MPSLKNVFRSFLTHSKKVATEFKKNLFSWIFYWLTDPLRLMPSDKCSLITAIATASISSLFNIASSGNVPFCQPQQLQCLHHGFTTKFTFVLHSFLPYRIGDDLQYTHYGFSARLSLSAMQAGALLMLFFALNGSQMFEELEAKWSVMIQCVYAAFVSITGAKLRFIQYNWIHMSVFLYALKIFDLLSC